MRALWLIGVGLIALVASEHISAQVSPVGGKSDPAAAQNYRDMKSLSAQEIDDLLNARGTAFTRVAELNGYPGPAQIIELAGDLGLSDDQTKALQDIKWRVDAVATSLGSEILEIEAELDRLFAGRTATKPRVNSMVTAVSGLSASLRAVHLAGHLDATAVLHPWQLGRYNELRGYYIATAPRSPSAMTSRP